MNPIAHGYSHTEKRLHKSQTDWATTWGHLQKFKPVLNLENDKDKKNESWGISWLYKEPW